MNKRKLIAVLCVLSFLLSSFAGCSSFVKKSNWKEEVIKEVPEEFTLDTCNQIYIDNHLYTFPCPVEEFLDNGWSFAESKTDDVIEGRNVSEEFYGLTNENGNTLTVALTNETDETLKVTECTVDSLTLMSSSGNVMLPSGVTFEHYDSREAVYDLLGKDVFTNIQENQMYDRCEIEYVDDNGNEISISMDIREYEGKDGKFVSISSITYEASIIKAYDFSQIIKMDIESVYENDASKIDPDQLTGDPEEFIALSREYLCYSILLIAGFEVDNLELTDGQMSSLDQALDKAYIVNTWSLETIADSLTMQKVMMTIKMISIDDVISYAFEKADERYEGNLDEWNTSSEYLDIFCEEVLNAYDELEKSDIPKTLVLDWNDSEFWQKALYAQLGYIE